MGAGTTRRAGDDGGFALVELLVVSAVLSIVLIGILNVLDTAASTVPRDVEWTHAIDESRVGLAGMVREIRQADAIHGATPNQIDFDVTRRGVARHVMYACDVPEPTGDRRRCTRVEAAVGAPLPAPASGAPVVVRVLNGTAEDPVFSYAPDAVSARYLTVRVRVPSTGERAGDRRGHAIVLDDGVELRNRGLGG